MIVYGDHHERVHLGALADALLARVSLITHDPKLQPLPLDGLRTILIAAGQLEQAAHDALQATLPAASVLAAVTLFHELTARAAEAFYAGWATTYSAAPRAPWDPMPILSRLPSRLRSLRDMYPDTPALVRMPEGFALYALYPEQYCLAALQWAREHPAPGTVAVIGIRTIGTSLAAVVAATLRACGLRAVSLTVRPEGHPFERHTEIDAEHLCGAEYALIVDEGPGLSGSSMAAVGAALVAAGIPRDRIAFLPGHAGHPGSAASEQVRAWWASTPRYVASTDDLTFDGLPLYSALAARLDNLLDTSDHVVSSEDVGGGAWRGFAYDDPAVWPPACAAFERPKLLCTTAGGKRYLWKFEGLAVAAEGITIAESVYAQMIDRANWCDPPLTRAHGWVCRAWQEGSNLTASDLTPETNLHIGSYIAQVAGTPLPQDERAEAQTRLADMLYWNTSEALGEDAAAATRPSSERAARWAAAGPPTFGDGRMAPHEWVATPEGLRNPGSSTHLRDHTMVGAQPVAWDLAGAIAEWNMDPHQQVALVQAYKKAGGPSVPPEVLSFYVLAYAAFRAGQCKLCASMTAHDPDEQQRLLAAYERYRARLSAELGLP
jgi:hypothetical protein